jgi:hypothetical protein
MVSPEWFIESQIADSSPAPLTENHRMIALQLGNLYALLGMVGVGVLSATTEAKVVRNYLIALWIADIGHIGITAYIMGYERSIDVVNWNSMTWGNIGVTVRLPLPYIQIFA